MMHAARPRRMPKHSKLSRMDKTRSVQLKGTCKVMSCVVMQLMTLPSWFCAPGMTHGTLLLAIKVMIMV